jgi:hypothetical protein
MPVIFLNCNYGVITGTYRQALADVVRSSAAQALSVPERPLMRHDIMVQFSDRGPADMHERDIEVLIFAHNYPSRADSVDERAHRISNDIATWCDDSELNTQLGRLRNFVWIILAPTGFAAHP